MAKKNRAFSRQLKREIKELRSENECLRSVSQQFKYRENEYRRQYNALRGRVSLLSREYIIGEVDAYHMRQAGLKPDVQLTNSMVREMMESDDFRKMFRIERDPEFIGMGTKYRVSLELLEPIITDI